MNGLRARSGPRAILAALASLGLIAALAMPAFAADENWATVTSHTEGSAENNHEDTWGEDCTKINPGGDTYELPDLAEGLGYSLVIVKAGAEASVPGFVNTLFEDPSAGQVVWADSDGDGAFSDGDKEISHIIICTAEEDEEPSEEESPSQEASPSEEESPSEEASPTEREGELGGTPTATPGGTLPDTSSGGSSQAPAIVLSLFLVAALGAMVYVRLSHQR